MKIKKNDIVVAKRNQEHYITKGAIGIVTFAGLTLSVDWEKEYSLERGSELYYNNWHEADEHVEKIGEI